MIKFTKKILVSLVIMFSIGISFAYTPTDKDLKIINSLGASFKTIYEKDSSQFDKIPSNISKLKKVATNDERLYYLLVEIEKIVNDLVGNGDNPTVGTYKIIEVIDGDTIKINYNGKNQNVRMIGVDAPEKNTSRFGYIECYGEEAYNYLVDLIGNNTEIGLEFDETQGKEDKYGRLLGYIFLNGNNLNEVMIKEGYAREYTYDKPYKYKNDFQSAETTAKNNKKGLWNATACNGERKPEEDNVMDDLANLVNEYNDWINSSSSSNDTSSNFSNNGNTYSGLCGGYTWYRGPRGGCYHWSGSKKVYGDHSCCK